MNDFKDFCSILQLQTLSEHLLEISQNPFKKDRTRDTNRVSAHLRHCLRYVFHIAFQAFRTHSLTDGL
jgi:hypothetical protein